MIKFGWLAVIALIGAVLTGPENFGSYVFLAVSTLSAGLAVFYEDW
jgi:hypothetical protein